MYLVFDLGNSFHKYAVFDDGDMIFRDSQNQLNPDKINSVFNSFPVDAAMISSVDEDQSELVSFIGTKTKTFILDQKTTIPIDNQYRTPETLGNDRLASVVGASATFPNQNVLVIDAGTCIKYDFIDHNSIYQGGAIAPGLFMRFEAMHNYTARLPLITAEQLESAKELHFRGDSTVASLLAGGAMGAILEADGFIREYEAVYPDLKVVCTGGDAPFFELHLKRKIFALPDLVLFGLNIILEHNLKQT